MRVPIGGMTSQIQGALEGLRALGSTAAAVISRDGLIVAADLPPAISQETFSIMCAAIMGAGMTATTELRRGPPQRIVLDSTDLRIAIFALTRKAMLVVALPARANVDAVEARLPDLRRIAEASSAT